MPVPPEMMKASEKLLKASMICSTRLKKMIGVSSGRVMGENFLTGRAPSISAAS